MVSKATRKSLGGGKRWRRRSGRKISGRSWRGPAGGALIGCSLEVRPNSYDHMRQSIVRARQFAGQRVKVKLPMWDFALHRDDGTGVRLHPHWGDRKVEALPLVPHADTVRPPTAGLGGSDGSGTFRWYKDLGVERKVKFDAAREKERPTPSQGPRSSGAAASSTRPSASAAAGGKQ